jgi:hypothetical protein
MLSLIKSKFLSNPESHTLRRYSELDKFAINSLKNKYINLFGKIKNLLYQVEGSKAFLQSVIVRKLSKEHYTTNVTSSINKLKLLLKERAEVAKQLSEINFVEVFNPNHTANTLSRLTIRQLITSDDAKTVSEYVHSIIKTLVANCNPSQLETLCKPILQGNLTETKMTLKQEIINQIKQRTTFMKRLLYIITGQRSDFNKLKIMENALKGLEVARGEKKIDLENISTVPAKIKNDINEIYEMQQENFSENQPGDFVKKQEEARTKEKNNS